MFLSVTVVLILGVASLAVDTGMHRVLRRDLQALVDIVALDLARELGTRTQAQLAAELGPGPTTALSRSLARNASDVLGDDLEVTADWGAWDGTAWDTAADPPSSVRVEASGEVGFAFAAGAGTASRTAYAGVSSGACYKVGSWAASVDSGNSALLDPVLRQMAMQSGVFSNGGAVRALSYTGLAQATVNLNDLAVGLGVGSVRDLATATVGLRSLYTQVKALAQPQNATVVDVLEVLRANASTAATVDMGTLLAANSGASALLDSTANVLDLVGGSVALLNGTNTANVYLSSALGSLANVNLESTITQGPHQYCGSPGDGATVGLPSDTRQVFVHIDGTLSPTTVDFVPDAISGLLGNVASAQIVAENHVSIDVEVAGTSSRLLDVRCGDVAGVDLSVENGLATVTLSTPLRATVRARLLGLSLPPLLNVNVDAVIRLNAGVQVVARVSPSGTNTLQVRVPPDAYDTPIPTSTGSVSIQSISTTWVNVSANVDAGGGSLGAWISLGNGQRENLIDSILGAGLTQLFSPDDPHSLSATVLDPIMGLAGARVGGSDVMLDSTPELSCANARLVG